MKPEVQPNKIVVLSGSGLSAESGLPTFRDSNGLWNEYSWHEVASPEGWKARPEAVLAFYNERRMKASQAVPNAAHEAIASLEAAYDVVVITQNVDELHELAGSKKYSISMANLPMQEVRRVPPGAIESALLRSRWDSYATVALNSAPILYGLVRILSTLKRRVNMSLPPQKCWWSEPRCRSFPQPHW